MGMSMRRSTQDTFYGNIYEKAYSRYLLWEYLRRGLLQIPLMGMSMRLSTPGFLQITSMGISTKRSAPDTFYGHVYEEVLLHILRGTDR